MTLDAGDGSIEKDFVPARDPKDNVDNWQRRLFDLLLDFDPIVGIDFFEILEPDPISFWRGFKEWLRFGHFSARKAGDMPSRLAQRFSRPTAAYDINKSRR